MRKGDIPLYGHYRGMTAQHQAFRPIIVIRFSQRISAGWSRRAYGPEANRPTWLGHRAMIFRRLLWPCLMRQSLPPAAVILILDEGDRDVAEGLFGFADPRLALAWASRGNPWGAAQALVADMAADMAGGVLLVRIDSDDMVGDGYLAAQAACAARARAAGKDSGYIVATDGYRSDLRRIQRIYYPSSPFYAWFGAHFDGTNIYGFNHSEGLVLHQPLVCPYAPWLQYLHGRNISNDFALGVATFEHFDTRLDRAGGRVGSWQRPVTEIWPAGFGPLAAVLDVPDAAWPDAPGETDPR